MKFLIFTALFLTCLACYSQNSENKKTERNCRIIYLQRPQESPTEGHLFDGKQSHKVQLSSMNFSLPVTLPEGDLTLGMTPNPVLQPEEFPSGAPTIKIPAKVRDLYIIVITDLNNKIFPIRMLQVDASEDQLKRGETLWINLTTHSVEGKLGEEILKVKPSGRAIGKAPLKNNGFFKAEFVYQVNGQGPFQPIMKKTWWFDGGSKNLGFIIDSGERVPRIFAFRDGRTPP